MYHRRCIHVRLLGVVCATVVVCVATVYSQAVIEGFVARSDGRAITLEWRTAQEQNISVYEIERSPAHQTDFKRVGSVQARGGQQVYRFIDENALVANVPGNHAATQSGVVYSYRLKIIDTGDKATYSSVISVAHTVSSVRRTWGMIKEMFR